MIMPSRFGIESYGNYGFLLASFTSLNLLLDAGANNAFLTFLSQGRMDRGQAIRYLGWVSGVGLVIALIFATAPTSTLDKVLPEIARLDALSCFIGLFIQQQIFVASCAIGESQRRSNFTQSLAACAALIMLLIVFATPAGASPQRFFATTGLVYGSMALLASRHLKTLEVSGAWPQKNATSLPQAGWRDFRAYCTPLLGVTLISATCGYLTRLLVQVKNGPIEQAFINLGTQSGMPALLFTASITRIIWREVAEDHAQANNVRLRRIFDASVSLPFFLATLVLASIFAWGREIMTIVAAEPTAHHMAIFNLMLLSVSFQALGQIGSVFCHATGNNQLYFRVSSAASLSTLFLTWIASYKSINPWLPGALSLATWHFLSQATAAIFLTRGMALRIGSQFRVLRIFVLFAMVLAIIFFDRLALDALNIELPTKLCLFVALIGLQTGLLLLRWADLISPGCQSLVRDTIATATKKIGLTAYQP